VTLHTVTALQGHFTKISSETRTGTVTFDCSVSAVTVRLGFGQLPRNCSVRIFILVP